MALNKNALTNLNLVATVLVEDGSEFQVPAVARVNAPTSTDLNVISLNGNIIGYTGAGVQTNAFSGEIDIPANEGSAVNNFKTLSISKKNFTLTLLDEISGNSVTFLNCVIVNDDVRQEIIDASESSVIVTIRFQHGGVAK